MPLAILVLLVGSLGFLGFGGALLVDPQGIMASIGFQVPDGVPATEIRAFYGGAEIALGALLGWCLLRPGWRRAGLVMNAVVYGCIGLSRLAGMIVDGSRSPFLSFALATELSLLLLSLAALWWLRERIDA